MPRWSVAWILALLLALPAASAFSSDVRDLSITYDADTPPVIIAAGELGLGGSLTGGLLIGGATTTALTFIPHLTIVVKGEKGASTQNVDRATIEVSSGALLWSWDHAGALALDVGAAYGIVLGLPEAPFPSADGRPRAGFLFASEAARGSASWSGEALQLTPLDATITIKDGNGKPLEGWNTRHINAQMTTSRDPEAAGVVFRASGPFESRIGAGILAGATGNGTDVALDVSAAQEDRFAQTAGLLDQTMQEFSEEAPSFAGQQGPLALLQQISGLLNGAFILVPGDGTSVVTLPIESRWGEDDFAIGNFNIVRGNDLSLAWKSGEMRMSGQPTIALGREGFAVDPPTTVWLFPILSLVLWLGAIAAIVWFFVRRPPTVPTTWSLRFASMGVYLVVLLIALVLWDKSFFATFGTSALTLVKTQGISEATLPQIGVLAGLEFVPWGIASLLFALPVRVMLGVALRYAGKGKSYKGIATAGGLVSLAIFGPIYALWCFNLVWSQALGRMPGG